MRPLRKSLPLLNLYRPTFLVPLPLLPPLQALLYHFPNSSKPRCLTTLADPIPPVSDAYASIVGIGICHSPAASVLQEAAGCSMLENTSTQCELASKTPSQSRTSILYNFSSDSILREQYRDPWNKMKIGELLKDLDALAATISIKHGRIDEGTRSPSLLVTASVDKVVLKKPIHLETDVNVAGSVTWVGRSSMEIQLQVSQLSKDPLDSLALVANFIFVARDSKTGKSAPINRLLPETDQEKSLWEEAEIRNEMRKKRRAEHKTDINRLQVLLSEGRIFSALPALADRDSVLVRHTCLENSFICQPQQKNIYGRIFGGFLMQKAYELAFSTAYAFAGTAPHFVKVDHIDFLKPVDVGNLLRFKSRVLYTQLHNSDKPMIFIEVVARATQPELRSSEVSNKFYFTFTSTVSPEAMKDGLWVRNVVPATE